MRGGRVVAGFAATALTAVALAACGSGTTASPAPGMSLPGVPTTTPTPPASAVSPADKDKQDALAAYRGMWQDFVGAGTTSDWQSPTLGRYATGVALTNLSRSLYTDHYNGFVTKGEPAHSAEVSSAEPSANPTKVIVTDCSDSTNALKYRADNGQLADNKPGGRRLINAIVEKQADGSWKVSDYGVHDLGTC